MESSVSAFHREPRNKGKIVGQKVPFKLKDIWTLRSRLQMEGRVRELALFNLGIDSKRRGCDLVALRVRDICHGDRVASRAIVMQHKTRRPVQFEITPAIRDAAQAWIKPAALESEDFLFPSRILGGWVHDVGLDPADCGTHSMRCTKATLICRRTKKLRAVQQLLGHSTLESTGRCLGIEADDALEISEQTEIRGRLDLAAPKAGVTRCGRRGRLFTGAQANSRPRPAAAVARSPLNARFGALH